MRTPELPITITLEQRSNKYVASRLAAEAFRAAAYDFTPDGDAVALAVQRGYLVVVADERQSDDHETAML